MKRSKLAIGDNDFDNGVIAPVSMSFTIMFSSKANCRTLQNSFKISNVYVVG